MKCFALRSLALTLVFAPLSIGFAQDASPAFKAMIGRMSTRAMDENPSLVYNPYTVLVKFRPGTPKAQMDLARHQIGAQTLDRFAVVPGLEVVSSRVDPALAAQWLSVMPGVEYAEVDYIVRTTAIPNDPSFGTLWGMRNTGQSGGTAGADIRAHLAWDIHTGGPETVVAVIDTGVQRNHPDLLANMWTNPDEIPGNGIDDDGNGLIDDVHGWDFVNNDNDPSDDNSHGTHCAGTIGGVGNNGVGVTGVAWNVKMLGLKFLSASGSGSTSNAVKAVDYCFRKKIKISNNSWGGGGYSSALFNAINNARSIGHLFIAAAGNSNRNNDGTPHYPSSYNLDNVIAVASIDRYDARSSFSNYGLTSVDLGAPGSSIYSTVPGSTYGTKSGTSMATPHVAGGAALLMSYRPGWSYQQIRDTLYNTVRITPAMTGRTVTGGVMNIFAALNYAQSLPNNAPQVSITSPSGGHTVNVGTSISFAGSAIDAEHGNLTAQLAWFSSRDGAIGSGASFSTAGLSAGTHTVTASVTDPGGLTGTKTVQVVVVDPIPNPPTNFAGTRISRSTVRLTWTDSSNNETGFELERQVRNSRTGNWDSPTLIQIPANTEAFEDASWKAGSRYRVRSKNEAGASAWTSYFEF